MLSRHTIDYVFEPGLVLSGFYRALAEGRIEGGRCPSCAHVYVPPRPRCPACGGGPMETVEVADAGTVVSCTVVHVPAPGLDVELPFGWARILLDGADVPIPHVVDDIVRVGQRVRAVWAPPAGRAMSWEAIRNFTAEAP